MTVVLLSKLSTRVNVEIVKLGRFCKCRSFIICSLVGVILWKRKGFHWSRAWCLMIMTWWNELRLSACVIWWCVKRWALLLNRFSLKGLIYKVWCRVAGKWTQNFGVKQGDAGQITTVKKYTKLFRPLSLRESECLLILFIWFSQWRPRGDTLFHLLHVHMHA